MKTFAPTITLDRYGEINRGGPLTVGRVVTPKGWEWVLSFAIAGCKWAIKEANKPSFRKMIIADLKKTKRENLQNCIDKMYKEIEKLKKELME